jgi:hypothetical protein
MSKLYKDGIVFASAFSPSGAQPLDNRTVVQSFSDLLEIDGNVTFGDTKYNGMLVSVIEDQQTYMLIDSKNSNLESAWKKIGSDESPIVMGDIPNSAVLKGGNNQVISEGGVALGEKNFVGLKGWYYSAMYAYDSHIQVLLSHEQKICNENEQISEPLAIDNIDGTLPNLAVILGIGTIVSLVNDAKYDNKFKIVEGGVGYVTLETIDGSNIPFSVIKAETVNDPEDYSIYCLSQPDKGMFDMGQDSFTTGLYNKATNGKATAFGFNNHAYGKFSFAEGRDNEAGYAAHVEGRNNKAIGGHSHVEGELNEALSFNSHAEGFGTKAGNFDEFPVKGSEKDEVGRYTHSEGRKTAAKGSGAHAEGYLTAAIGKNSP